MFKHKKKVKFACLRKKGTVFFENPQNQHIIGN